MKNSIYLFALILHFSGIVPGKAQQKTSYDDLKKLPKNWKLKESSPSTYSVITTHYDYSMIGPFIQKKQISGEYTRGLEGSLVRWNNVRIADNNNLEAPFDSGKIQPAMEDFTYVPSAKMMNADAFEDFPQDLNSYLYKNLVWDMMAFDAFSWLFTDSLSLNIEYKAQNASCEIELAGQGTFDNRDIRLTWIGVTQKNMRICAVIKFSVLNNPLTMHSEQLKFKGRSHYWGNVYVCLQSKQIEYAELYEDVIMDMKVQGIENNQLLNTVRTIQVERLNSIVQTGNESEFNENRETSYLKFGSETVGQ